MHKNIPEFTAISSYFGIKTSVEQMHERKSELFPVKHTLTSGEMCLSPMCKSLYVDWTSKIPLAKRISAMSSAVARLSASSMCTYVC